MTTPTAVEAPACADKVGTIAGHSRHRAAKQPPCEACLTAKHDYNRDWWARMREHTPALPPKGKQPHAPQPELPDWGHAACRGMDTNLFFPAPQDAAGFNAAAAVCSGCPIREPCGAWALTNREEFGVWGGMGAKARERLRRQPQETPDAQEAPC